MNRSINNIDGCPLCCALRTQAGRRGRSEKGIADMTTFVMTTIWDVFEG
jgi:hypothetical protein